MELLLLRLCKYSQQTEFRESSNESNQTFVTCISNETKKQVNKPIYLFALALSFGEQYMKRYYCFTNVDVCVLSF